MSHHDVIQSMISLLVFGVVLLLLGALLSASGILPFALVCLVLGTFFCGAGLGVRRRQE